MFHNYGSFKESDFFLVNCKLIYSPIINTCFRYVSCVVGCPYEGSIKPIKVAEVCVFYQ